MSRIIASFSFCVWLSAGMSAFGAESLQYPTAVALPPDAAGKIVQATEATIGPYELVDFFLYHFLRFGAEPERILFLAKYAQFDRDYTPADVRQWLAVFLRRFFANQFKRSCTPERPSSSTHRTSLRTPCSTTSTGTSHLSIQTAPLSS